MSEQLQREQWLCFQVENEMYAHPAHQIREILSYTNPVPVPGSLACIEGVLNIRGEIVTIASCRDLLGMSRDVPSEHIIIVETTVGLLGISVDEVDKITLLNKEDIEPTQPTSDYSPVKATINKQQQLLILTDFDRCVKELENYE